MTDHDRMMRRFRTIFFASGLSMYALGMFVGWLTWGR